jgi:hypothetical protein
MAKKNNLPWPLSEFGTDLESAFLNMMKQFLKPFNEVVALTVKRTGFKKKTETVGGKKYTIDFTKYPKDKPAEVGARFLLLIVNKPVEVGQAVWDIFNPFNKKNFDENVPEDKRHFEPISMTVIVGVLVALIPVLLPKIIELIGSITEAGTASDQKKTAEAEKALEQEKTKQQAQKNQTIMIGAAVGGVAVVGLLLYATRRK